MLNTRRLLASFLVLLLTYLPGFCAGFELEPLTTRNLSPAVIGFGLPVPGPARVLGPGAGQAALSFDLVNNYALSEGAGESLLFDGESYRAAFSFDYGISPGVEFGAELPLIAHRGGFLDSFIEGWHDFFGLPQGGREQTPRNRLNYRYSRVGGEGFSLDSDSGGVGDFSLRAAWQLWQNSDLTSSLALRGSLKLPTGDASELTGSGSTDVALWLSGEQRRQVSAGLLLFYGGAGALLGTDGDLLPDQRRNLVGLVNLGFGWQPWSSLGLQVQFDGHSSFYRGSDFRELNRFAGQLAMGGSIALGEKTVLELAVVEDIIVRTTPDVGFHLTLRHRY